MRHHQHPGLAGSLNADGTLAPHPDAEHADARVVWFPVATDSDCSPSIGSLEGLLCVPTRAGAMRIAAVPHVVEHLTLGDEVAVVDWEGEPLARGELAMALHGTVRCVSADERGWLHLARMIDAASGEMGACWFDAIGEQAVAASVPRSALVAVLELLATAADRGELRWEYVTPARHA
jgi:hypothetical protein